MPMTWNEAADAKLFAGVLATNKDLKLNYDDLANWMGPECTVRAVQHRITAVRKMTKDSETASEVKPKGSVKRKAAKEEDGAEETNGDADETPSKPKKARAPRKKATSKKIDVHVDDAAEDDGEGVMNGVKAEAKEEDEEGEVLIQDAGIVGGEV